MSILWHRRGGFLPGERQEEGLEWREIKWLPAGGIWITCVDILSSTFSCPPQVNLSPQILLPTCGLWLKFHHQWCLFWLTSSHKWWMRAIHGPTCLSMADIANRPQLFSSGDWCGFLPSLCRALQGGTANWFRLRFWKESGGLSALSLTGAWQSRNNACQGIWKPEF